VTNCGGPPRLRLAAESGEIVLKRAK